MPVAQWILDRWALCAAVIAFFVLSPQIANARPVHLEFDRSDAQASYAAARLTRALGGDQGLGQPEDRAAGAFKIRLILDRNLKAEAFAIASHRHDLSIRAGDGRGLIYGALSVAETLRGGTPLDRVGNTRGTPALPFRAIKFNLPWDSYRSSSALDLHYDTVRDVKFWEAFLDMMAENRFNVLTLWNLHPFPYMIKARNFPEASPFTDAEQADWKRFYQAVFRMAKARGIETYVLNWNILVSREFASAHALTGRNHYPYYKGRADTSELVKRYTRESVTQMLDEYPDLTGFGFSFGEQMGGMTPQQRQEWIDDTIIAGMKDAKRPTKMIFRAPFSADLGQGGSTDVTTERMTRNALEDLGDTFDGPIWMEIKFNWSHGHSTPELVKVHGGELKDTYFKPAPTNYKVAWMVRNEDFYALRWGVPDFIRAHLAQNGRQPYVGGYFVGSENYIPAKDYFTAANQSVGWKYAFERQWLFYKLWGRLLYDPATPDAVFEAEFMRRYGPAGKPLLRAYALASATQLDFVTNVDFGWDFTVYGEGMMVLGPKGLQPMSVERLIEQKPLTTDRLSVADFVARRNAGTALPKRLLTPLALARQLEARCAGALRLVEGLDVGKDTSLMYEVADVKIWATLGLYYAEKLRGAVALQTYRTRGDESQKRLAIKHLERSLGHWDAVIAISRPIYRDMPLAHYNPPDNARNDDNLFHWAHLRPFIADDVEVARSAAYRP